MTVKYLLTLGVIYITFLRSSQASTYKPTAAYPTIKPSASLSYKPTFKPTFKPTITPSSSIPTFKPTFYPSRSPTISRSPTNPTVAPTFQPSNPTARPTNTPSLIPSCKPTFDPTHVPSKPTKAPSLIPSGGPTFDPTRVPSLTPTNTPSLIPSCEPTIKPSYPTHVPSVTPTNTPSLIPSCEPTFDPTHVPSSTPTDTPSLIPSCEPTFDPTNAPSLTPTNTPSLIPSCEPTFNPTHVPSLTPTNTPSLLPSFEPTFDPTHVPSLTPTNTPSLIPSCEPTFDPTHVPSSTPTNTPSLIPSCEPTFDPTHVPSLTPTDTPSLIPSCEPTFDPTHVPSLKPTNTPSLIPSCEPTFDPTHVPSLTPTNTPSLIPSREPTFNPTHAPSLTPTNTPSLIPSCEPTFDPTHVPSFTPTNTPSLIPSCEPTFDPTHVPSLIPTNAPSLIPSCEPTFHPTHVPSLTPTNTPSLMPSCEPTFDPTHVPSLTPTDTPSLIPSCEPTFDPTHVPSFTPTNTPSLIPSCEPTFDPTQVPSLTPTNTPSLIPSCEPTFDPTHVPSLTPTNTPSLIPSCEPTFHPTQVPSLTPTNKPSLMPSCEPTFDPTHVPSLTPTNTPSLIPSCEPTFNPTHVPSLTPTDTPSLIPSCEPTFDPTHVPSLTPTNTPSLIPSCEPTFDPTHVPSLTPTNTPSLIPSCEPTFDPTHLPSLTPTNTPSLIPSCEPTFDPTHVPSVTPTNTPSLIPSCAPTFNPTDVPSLTPTATQSLIPSCEPTFDPAHVSPSLKPSIIPSISPSSSPIEFSVIKNAGFETGLTFWVTNGTASASTAGCYSGGCVRLGATTATNGDSTISQTFVNTVNQNTLSFYYKMTCPDSDNNDWVSATLVDHSAAGTSYVMPKVCVTSTSWTKVTIKIIAGHSYTLTLISHDDNSANPSYTLFDSVSLAYVSYSFPPSSLPTAPTLSPLATGTIGNPDFEQGLSYWSTTGTVSIISTDFYSGISSARLGSTSPTDGDSTIIQSFTAPFGKNILSFYYKMTCPDEVKFDWATAKLVDNIVGMTWNMTKVCENSTKWRQVKTSIIPGHAYTLTLINHDDNYPDDASYTLFDNITFSSISPSSSPIEMSVIKNAGFETGLTYWVTNGTASALTAGCYNGGCVRLGATAATNGDSTISQTFVNTVNQNTLSFYYKMTCPGSVSNDWVSATLVDHSAAGTSYVMPKVCVTSTSWTKVTIKIIAGHSYTLTLISHDDNSANPSYTLFDSVSLAYVSYSFPPSSLPTAPTLSPLATGTIGNPDFEQGLSYWSTTGTASIITTDFYSGISSARLGSTSPTDGDSTIIQSFTAPIGKNILSFYYKMTCPDEVKFDWATAKLVDNIVGMTWNMTKVCENSTKWRQVKTSIIPGHAYTLTLINHDDNYPNDASYTLFDNITFSSLNLSPTFAPSSMPSLPTAYNPPVQAFFPVTQTFSNLKMTDLNTPSGIKSIQDAVSWSLDNSVSSSDVHIISVTEVQSLLKTAMRVMSTSQVEVEYEIYFVVPPGKSATEVYLKLSQLLTAAITNGVFESNLINAASLNGATGLSQLSATTAPVISDLKILVSTISPSASSKSNINDESKSTTPIALYGGIMAGVFICFIIVALSYYVYIRKSSSVSNPLLLFDDRNNVNLQYPMIYENKECDREFQNPSYYVYNRKSSSVSNPLSLFDARNNVNLQYPMIYENKECDREFQNPFLTVNSNIIGIPGKFKSVSKDPADFENIKEIQENCLLKLQSPDSYLDYEKFTEAMNLVNSEIGGLDSITSFQFLNKEEKTFIASSLKPSLKRMFEKAFL